MLNRQHETNSFSMGEFVWWTGVVEDRMDPKKLGRCRVRILGYHTDDKTDMPTEELPWAYPMQPIVSGAMNGIGVSPTGLLEGTWVVGFFRDGHNAQDAIIMGSIGGIPGKTPTGDKGFEDPNGKYPKEDFISEADTNRISRNEKIEETIIQTKKDEREKDVPRALGDGPWDEKETPYAAEYPFCHTRETESGITEEFDDTEGAERYGLYHPAGGWYEMHNDGDEVRKIEKDKYEIVLGDEYILVKGDVTVTIEGNANLLVKGNSHIETQGNHEEYVHGDYKLLANGNMYLQTRGAMFIDSLPQRVNRLDINKPTADLGYQPTT